MPKAFAKIFFQAVELTKTQKFLWAFGLILVLINAVGFVAGSQPDSVWLFWSEFILIIVLVVVSSRAQAGIIIAVKALMENQDTSFTKAWLSSKLFYLRLLYIQLLLSLTLVVLAGILWLPVSFLISHHQLTQAWILGSFGGLIFLSVLVLSLLLLQLAPLFVVIFDQKAWESLDKSLALVKQFFWQLLGFGLIVLILEILPIVFLRLLTYYNHSFAVKVIGSVTVCVVEIFVYVFLQTAWVLLFKELVKPEKFENQETASVPDPEVIS